MFAVNFTPHGLDDLRHLSPDIQKRIIAKVNFFASQENPILFAKALVRLPPVTHRFRVGDYRVAFYLRGQTIFVDRVKHQKEVYLD